MNAPQLSLATILVAHDPLSSSAYPMITHAHPVAGNLSIKTLVARQCPTKLILLLYEAIVVYDALCDALPLFLVAVQTQSRVWPEQWVRLPGQLGHKSHTSLPLLYLQQSQAVMYTHVAIEDVMSSSFRDRGRPVTRLMYM